MALCQTGKHKFVPGVRKKYKKVNYQKEIDCNNFFKKTCTHTKKGVATDTTVNVSVKTKTLDVKQDFVTQA